MVIALTLALNTIAHAQDVRIERKPRAPEREPGLIVPGPQADTTRPPDADYYSEGTRVVHDPAFFQGLSTRTETGRAGLSGWTAPNQPVGAQVSGFSEVTGWFSLGFSYTWGSPSGAHRARQAP
jgi:hypothetical protein